MKMEVTCFGSHSAVIRAERVFLSETTHAPSLRTPAHSHPFFCLHFVLRGVYEESTKQGSHHVEPGRLLFKPPGEVHWNDFRSVGAVTMRFELEEAADPALAEALPARVETLHAPHLVHLASRAHGELARRDGLSPLIAESIALELFGAVARMSVPSSPGRSSSLARRCASLLDDRFQQPYRLGLAAEELGVDRATLARAFREEHGCSVGEYIRRLRVRLVAERLRSGSARSLADLAADAGFADQSHMTRTFKAEFGEAPGRWSARFVGDASRDPGRRGG